MIGTSKGSGVALIVVGGIFIRVTNNSSRTSTLGLIVGVAIIVLGVVRLLLPRKVVPPTL